MKFVRRTILKKTTVLKLTDDQIIEIIKDRLIADGEIPDSLSEIDFDIGVQGSSGILRGCSITTEAIEDSENPVIY